MSVILLLVVLFLLFGLGGGTYSRWGAAGPAWGGNVLYVIAVIFLILLVLGAFFPGRYF